MLCDKKKFIVHSSIITLSCLFSSTYLAAQQLEEVVVTAQIRAKGLKDVSVSVSALDGDLMAEQGLGKVEDFAAFIPNFTFAETGIGTTLYIRGIGSGINQGFEQSVGMYIDGIYHGRAQLTRAPVFDMERVEILRGPQITLFGNNSVGGALSLITRKPDPQPQADISLLYEPDHGELETIFTASGYLTDSLGLRFAYRHYEMDGYFYNATLDRDEPQRDNDTLRLTASFEPTDNVDAVLKLEQSNFDTVGRQLRIFHSQPSVGYGASSTNYAVANNVTGQDLNDILSQFPSVNGATIANPEQSFTRYSNGDNSDNQSKNVTLKVNWQLPSGYVITSILGHVEYDYTELCDCDFSAAEIVPLLSEEAYDQQSVELRLLSPEGNTLEFISGIYYQQDEMQFNDALYTLPSPSGFYDLLAGIPLTASGADTLVGRSVPRDFHQEGENQSVFGELTWHVTDHLRLIGGARYTKTSKEARRELSYKNLDGSEIGNEAVIDALDIAYGVLFKAFRHDIQGQRKESRTGYNLTLEWDATDDMLVYGSYKVGYKPGGYDVRSNAPPQRDQVIGNPLAFSTGGAFEFEDERVEAFELGSKISIGGEAEINIAYYYTEMSDLQMSIFDGALGFNVDNAAKAVSQGIELDGRWYLNEYWLLSGSVGFMDFEFKDYLKGQCTGAEQLDIARRISDGETVIGPEGQTFSQGTSCLADYSGQTNQYVADYSGSLALSYEREITDHLLFRSSLDVIFSDDYSPAQNLDPLVQQQAYQKWNLRLALADMDGQWEVALLGRNIFDEEVLTYANDAPLSSSQFGTISHYGFYDRPASWALQAKYRFQ